MFAKTRSYYDKSLQLSLEIPESWSKGESQDFALIFFAPSESSYRANIGFNVGLLKPPTLERLEELIQESYQDQSQGYPKYKVTLSHKFMQDECPAYLRRYEWVDPETGLHFSQIQAFILAGPNAFYSVDGSSLKQYEAKYIPALEGILTSLRFIPTATEAE